MKQDIEYAVPLFKAGAEWRINSVWHDAREREAAHCGGY